MPKTSMIVGDARDVSPARPRTCDLVDGRARGQLRKFALSRMWAPDLTHRGQFPGVRKAGW